jgi:hypothetical protein
MQLVNWQRDRKERDLVAASQAVSCIYHLSNISES